MSKKIAWVGAAAALMLAVSPGLHAKVSAEEAARLGNSLTPLGAQKAGNGKDPATGLGIPDWNGGLTKADIPKTYTKAGQHHPDPFASDKVIFTINAQNLSKYADKVPGGVQELIKTYGFDDPKALFDNSLFFDAVEPELEAKMLQEFERIKSGF